MRLGNRIALIILALLIGWLLFYQTPLMSTARGATWNFLVTTVGRAFSVGTLDLTPDVAEQLETLQAQNITLQSQLKDYDRLRAQLGSLSLSNVRAIPAAVVGRPIDTFQSKYVISQGITNGVVLGAPVVIRGSTLIGFISDVSTHTAIVQLLFDPGINLTAEIVADEAENNTRGLLVGQHYTSLLVSTIPRDIPITQGQKVVTAATEHIPYGLFIGTVATVTNKENEPYQTAEVGLPYSPEAIRAIHVLVSP